MYEVFISFITFMRLAVEASLLHNFAFTFRAFLVDSTQFELCRAKLPWRFNLIEFLGPSPLRPSHLVP